MADFGPDVWFGSSPPALVALEGLLARGVASRKMSSVWVESLGVSLGQALDLLAGAVRDCTDELWKSPMWPVPAPEPDHEFLGPDWNPVTDPALRSALARRWVGRRSAPWGVAWHALEVFDYDLNGEFSPWSPPRPFTGHPHWRDLASLPAAWSRPEMLAYAEYCRDRTRNTLAGMTDEKAATPLPPAHRYADQPYARILVALVGHTTEHASQIRQFVTAAGVAPGR